MAGFGAPIRFPNLSLWYDLSDSSTVTVDISGNVSSVVDKAGSGYTIGQATSTQRPTYGVATQNGLNLAAFDGTDDNLTGLNDRTAEFFWGSSRQQATWIFAAQWISGRRFGASVWNASGVDQFYQDISVGPYLYFRHSSTNSDVSGAYSSTSFGIYTFRVNLATPQILHRRNGSVVFTSTPASTTAFGSASSYRLNVPLASGPANFTFGEMAYFARALDDVEIASVESYMRGKWGV